MIDADPPPEAPPRRTSLWVEIPHDGQHVQGRSFRDGSTIWTVLAITRAHLDRFGLAPRALPRELEDGWLSFECGAQRRRFAPIPADWQTMMPAELRELCLRATIVSPNPKG